MSQRDEYNGTSSVVISDDFVTRNHFLFEQDIIQQTLKSVIISIQIQLQFQIQALARLLIAWRNINIQAGKLNKHVQIFQQRMVLETSIDFLNILPVANESLSHNRKCFMSFGDYSAC